MKKTLQDQYLLIKEGKGHKGVFLADAKRDFPHIVPNAATFNEAVASLKTKNIISENVIGLSAIAGYEPRKKETYETAFEAFLAEARKKKENEDEKVKAEEKKVSKPVEKDLEHNFDNKDDKNPDNLIFGQIMMGYYTEMKDPKNADKTMQQIKDIVLKNLSKDPIHYTKDGQFGVKDLGYVTEHPGLGTPKEPKGKYASSGYGNLNEGMDVGKSLELDARIALNMLGYSYAVLPHYSRQDLVDTLRRESKERFGKKELDDLADQLEATLEESKESWKDRFTEKPSEPKFSDEEKEADRKKKREAELERRRKAGESLEEITLRRAIQEMIDAELEEAYQLVNINPRKSDKERQERDTPSAPSSTKIPSLLVKKLERRGLMIEDGVIKMPKLLQVQIEQKKIDFIKDLSLNKGLPYSQFKALADTSNYTSAGGNMLKFKKAKPNEDGSITIYPSSDVKEDTSESLRESVEKDLAAINKEAEKEILQSKLDKIQELIDKKQSQLGKLDEDEDMKALTDVKKVKEIQKDIKALEKAKSKVEKMIGKHKGKKKEVIDETDGTESSHEYPDVETAEKDWKENSDMGQSDFE
jgi:hypothetical protein